MITRAGPPGLFFMLFAALSIPCLRAEITVTVSAGENQYRDLPMFAAVPVTEWDSGAVLVDPVGNRIRARMRRTERGWEVHWILPRLERGEQVTYRLERAPSGRDGIGIRKAEEGLRVSIAGDPFTTYRPISGHKPICFPLFGPGGVSMTRSYPMIEVPGETRDHPHHRSLWFTHGAVNGIDFWSEGPGAGKILQRTITFEEGPVLGIITTTNDWLKPDGSPVCSDRRELRFYRVSSGRLIDVEITVFPSAGPVRFGDTKEGSFGIRTAPWLKPDANQGAVVLNSNGDRNRKAWGKRARWLDASGPFEGKILGIAILEHPSSFRAPTYWHARTYGLIAANPFGLHRFLRDKSRDGSHTLEPGSTLRFRFRLWLHEGSAETAGVEAKWRQFAHPPTVRVQEK